MHARSARETPAPVDGHLLGEQLAVLARELHALPTPQDVLDRVVTAAVTLVPGAQEATVSRVRRRRTTTVAASSPQAAGFDALEQELSQGPCLDAPLQERSVRVGDLGTQDRWPLLAGRAAEVGVRSALCVRLFVDADGDSAPGDLGALNVLSPQVAAFDEHAEFVAGLMAAHAAVAVADTEQLANVRAALDSRDLIGQAKGVLMTRHRITADAAFSLLTRHSQETNRKLRDVAADVTTTGDLEV